MSRTIGLEKSTFVNSTGLPAEGHLMTARDLAMLAHYLIYTYPEYYHFFGEKEFKYRDKFVFHNRNPLIFAGYRRRRTEDRFHQGGRIRAGGQRQARRPAAASSWSSGLNTAKDREAEPRRLLDWGFKSFKPFRLFDQGQKVSDALVWGGTQHYVPLVGNGNIDIILPATATGKVIGVRSCITGRSRRRSARATRWRCCA